MGGPIGRANLAVAVCLATAFALITPSVAAAAGAVQFTGDAYGSYAFVGANVKSQKSGLVALVGPCGPATSPTQAGKTVASVSQSPYVTSGLVATSVTATDSQGTQQSLGTTDVHQANVLNGQITADELYASSSTSTSGSGFQTSGAGSRFVNLVAGGHAISATPAPNTRVDLPGYGYAIVNEQFSQVGATAASMTVNMVHVFVTVQNSQVPVGTQIIVSHAYSGLQPPPAGTLDGEAYGSLATAQKNILADRSALVTVPCQGTNGVVNTKTVNSSSNGTNYSTATIVDTAMGLLSGSSATVETTSKVEAASLLQALATADVMQADAHAAKNGTTFTTSDSGTYFQNITVQGHPEIDDQVAPNTQVPIAGLGTLWLRREITTRGSIEIRMMELVVSQQNSFGIPVGTDIRMAVARAAVF